MDISLFSTTIEGKSVALYRLSSGLCTCYITNYGARVVSLSVQSAAGDSVDVVLGFDSISGYLSADEQYHGATVGRYANRIAGGEFGLEGKTYFLAKNNGEASLHGGVHGFHNRVWEVKSHEIDSITLEFLSADMDQGFPGTLKTRVTYTLEESTLIINYKAICDSTTVFNPTHHSYFNLNGESAGSILDHQLQIASDYYTPVDQTVVPNGRLDLVMGTPFDFRRMKSIGESILEDDEQLIIGNGYDHNFAVRDYLEGRLSFVAKAIGDQSKVSMEVWSTEPGVQLYTANHLTGNDIGKFGPHRYREAFCLETQHFPDSPNQAHFPPVTLHAGESFDSETQYRFGVTV